MINETIAEAITRTIMEMTAEWLEIGLEIESEIKQRWSMRWPWRWPRDDPGIDHGIDWWSSGDWWSTQLSPDRVSQHLVPRLSVFYVLFQFLMNLVKVNYKGLGSGRSKILFGMNHEVRMVPFVHKERWDTNGSTQGIIVSEFYQQKKFQSVVLLIIAVYLNILF